MSDKKKYTPLTTPAGIASFPRLNKPETEVAGKPVEPRFSCTLLFQAAEVEEMNKLLQGELDEAVKAFKKKNPKMELDIVHPLKQVIDRDGNPVEGQVKLSAKTKAFSDDGKERRVPLFDAKGAPLTSRPDVGGGSKLKMAVAIAPYDMAKSAKGKKWTEIGLTLYLNAVKILDLKSFGGKNAEAYGFGEQEDGYEASEDSAEDSSDFQEEVKDDAKEESVPTKKTGKKDGDF